MVSGGTFVGEPAHVRMVGIDAHALDPGKGSGRGFLTYDHFPGAGDTGRSCFIKAPDTETIDKVLEDFVYVFQLLAVRFQTFQQSRRFVHDAVGEDYAPDTVRKGNQLCEIISAVMGGTEEKYPICRNISGTQKFIFWICDAPRPYESLFYDNFAQRMADEDDWVIVG